MRYLIQHNEETNRFEVVDELYTAYYSSAVEEDAIDERNRLILLGRDASERAEHALKSVRAAYATVEDLSIPVAQTEISLAIAALEEAVTALERMRSAVEVDA